MKYIVTIVIGVTADSEEEAIEEGDSIMHNAFGFLFEDVNYKVITAEEE